MRRLIVLLFVLLLATCGTPETAAPPATPRTAEPTAPPTAVAASDPCPAGDLQVYRSAYRSVVQRWGLAVIAAGQTPVASLKAPIEQLQKISDELAALTPPPCARAAQDATRQAMQQTIAGYQDLMAQKDIGQQLRNAIDMMAQAQAAVNALPNPLPPTSTPFPTFTPVPTLTPVPTKTPTPTITPSPTATPRSGYMSNQAQLYESPTSTNPVRTIFKGTRVTVFETQKGRTHIRAGTIEGWVSQGAVVIR